MEQDIRLAKNLVVAKLQKPASQLTKDDIIRYVESEGIEMINFMYPAGDGRLKTLNFVVNDRSYLDTILSCGERVDGSSLFSYIEPDRSDLYVMPRFSTAFRDPFAEIPTLCMLCRFFDKDGEPLAASPANTLDRACKAFTEVTSLHFQAMGELEFYVIAPVENDLFPATDQKGYHESAPFAKFNDFRAQAMMHIARTGAQIKYGHSEVGNFTEGGLVYEQHEIEFLPVDASDAADQLVLAKWALRRLAAKMGLIITFAPKITVGKAGSGLHIHMRFVDGEGKSVMLDKENKLSEKARTAIAGMMDMARSITALGNANPVSYLRLVPNQEAPTAVCWGDRNRSVLVRVPLGWTSDADMCALANPGSTLGTVDVKQKQTVEIRSADASADVYLLMAAVAVACRHGFEMEEALEKAAKTYVDVNIHRASNAARLAELEHLPVNCAESADCLEQRRDVYEAHGVFSPWMIDSLVQMLRSMPDAEARKLPKEEMRHLVEKYFHCG